MAALVLALAGTAATARAQDAKPSEAKPVEAKPRDTEQERLERLEKRVAEQQKEIDALLREAEGRAIRGKAPPKAPDATAPASDAPPTFEWGFDDSFFVKGRIGGASYAFRPRAGIQLDYRAFPHEKPNDQFVLRRARVGFEGNFGAFGFNVQVQPLRGPIPLVDAFIQYQQIEEFRIKVGHYKTPFSLDNGITGDFTTDFVERPMILQTGGAALSPDFHPGAEILGSFGGGILQYWLSAQNVVDSNTVQQSDPLICARLESAYSGFALGVAAYWERLAKTTSFSGLTPGQFRWFTPVDVRGWTQAYEVDASFYAGPFWARTEFAWAMQERRRVLADGNDGTPLIVQGAYATVGWVFWGPNAGKAHPIGHPFEDWNLFSMDIEKSRKKHTVGAEFVVRLEWMRLDDARGGRRLDGGNPAVPSTAANAARVRGNEATALSVGFNLSPIDQVEILVDYVRVRVGDQARAESRHSRWSDEILIRAQLDF